MRPKQAMGRGRSRCNRDQRQVTQLRQVGRCNSQTGDRAQIKTRRFEQPSQQTKENNAETNRRQDIVGHHVERVLWNEGEQERGPDP